MSKSGVKKEKKKSISLIAFFQCSKTITGKIRKTVKLQCCHKIHSLPRKNWKSIREKNFRKRFQRVQIEKISSFGVFLLFLVADYRFETLFSVKFKRNENERFYLLKASQAESSPELRKVTWICRNGILMLVLSPWVAILRRCAFFQWFAQIFILCVR